MRLAGLATHIPTGRIAAETIIAAAGGTRAEAQVFCRMFDMTHVSAVPEGETLMPQLSGILDDLNCDQDVSVPDALIHVHGQPLQVPNGVASPIQPLRQSHPFLANVQRCYDVDQHNCSGMFWALDLARTLLGTGLATSVLILGGDSHIGLPVRDRYVPGCTLMGDAFCGIVVDLDQAGPQFGKIALHTHPEFASGRAGTTAQMGAFFAAHSDMVARALEDVNFGWSGKGALLPHNVNRMAWSSFARSYNVAASRIRLDLLPDVGHCYVCDPFLLLAAERERDPHLRGAPTLLSVGMGGYVGAAGIVPAAKIIEKSENIKKEAAPCMQLLDY
ncbi:3-oxoacyl-[acyl-carrier-protein] synthase-3 [Yoonia maritima]|uniref:3-oxoacyl-[acyl-carrier-protein] synthase-3 n=1 Tax=Yoonia maritima TaxID=1435347 RepID=A0A2T0VXA6_9RHOB|nr:hypothetical protein [Yoonia maritima]PRY76664.1 3-oxoacyl-[acyl-carrier-protein] synthase-3 [Yoonia maritima]